MIKKAVAYLTAPTNRFILFQGSETLRNIGVLVRAGWVKDTGHVTGHVMSPSLGQEAYGLTYLYMTGYVEPMCGFYRLTHAGEKALNRALLIHPVDQDELFAQVRRGEGW